MRRAVSAADDFAHADVPFKLQVNFTDTKLSHRFVRFEIPDLLSYEDSKREVQAYLDKKLNNKVTTGVVAVKL